MSTITAADSLPAHCDGLFGPLAYECNGRFDFTLAFEQSILNIGPSAVLLLAAPLRIYQLRLQSRKVASGTWHCLHVLKIVAYVTFAALQLTLLVLWARVPAATWPPTRSHGVSIAAATLAVLDAVALGALSQFEHTRSVRPSSIICLYFIISILFDTVQCRTLWLLSHSEQDGTQRGLLRNLAIVFSAALASKVVSFLLEVQGKRRILLHALRGLGAESTSGIVARGFFWWLNNLLMRGYKSSLSLMTLDDIDDKLRSETLLNRALHYRKRERYKRKNGNRSTKHGLVLVVLHSTRSALLQGVLPRTLLIAFRLSQPFLINRTIVYVEGNRGPAERDVGYGLIAATGLLYLGTALATSFYQHKLFRSVTMVRGILVSMICSSTLGMDSSTASTAGSSTLTLTSSDVDKICGSFEDIHELWANPIEIGIASWLLERQLGLGCVGPAFTVICECTITLVILPREARPQQDVSVAIQTNSILVSLHNRDGSTFQEDGPSNDGLDEGYPDPSLYHIQYHKLHERSQNAGNISHLARNHS